LFHQNFLQMSLVTKLLTLCALLPTLLFGQKLQQKPIWQFDLQFDFAKADLRSEYFPRLDSLAVALQDSTFIVSLKAHTDAVGDAEANFQLSQRRAQAVKTYLITKNAPAAHIDTEGVGEAQPLDENDTDMGRQRNRRVSVTVIRRLAQVSGVVIDSVTKKVMAHVKVILTSKFIKDSVFTDSNGKYSLIARLNQPAKIQALPDTNKNCFVYNGLLFPVKAWTTTHDVRMKCKSEMVIVHVEKPFEMDKPNMDKIEIGSKRVPQNVTISGVVKNDQSKTIENARLIFTYQGGRDTVFTDKKGQYSFSKLLYREVQVSISANTHLPLSQTIIADTAIKKVNFKIQTIEVGKKAALQSINFFAGTCSVMPHSESSLADLEQFMRENRKCRIEIRGHVTALNPTTPYIGKPKDELSYQRAKSIYEYLVAHGIKAKRMTYKGYVNTDMIFQYPNDEDEHRANRRVEIKILRK
jgi:outer membrane protein OmpA-like peptidoglycan-associated protein